MRRTFFAVFVIEWVILSSISFSATYGGGSGTADDPYQIWTPEQMNTIGANPADWGKCFKLMTDIDMSAYTGTQYNIIGNSTIPFTGTFNGDGYVIRNLTCTKTVSTYPVGLFGKTSSATIKNMGVENVRIDFNCSDSSSVEVYMGSIAGLQSSGIIANCYATGSVNSVISSSSSLYIYTGGLIGQCQGTVDSCWSKISIGVKGTSNVSSNVNVGGLIGLLGRDIGGNMKNCWSDMSIQAIGENPESSTIAAAGGLVGYMQSNSSITNSWSRGIIFTSANGVYNTSCTVFAGGAVGRMSDGILVNCNSIATVTADGINAWAEVGGLVGNQWYGTISNCFSTGAVNSSSSNQTASISGGLVGFQYRGSIVNSYSLGSVNANSPVSHGMSGGLVGWQYDSSAKIEKCYSVGQVNATGAQVSKGGLLGFQDSGSVLIGTVKDCFWDIQTSRISTSLGGNDVQGKTTAQMQTQGTFTSAGWDFNPWNVGKTGNALQFDGIDDYVIMNDPNYYGVTGTQSRTCSAWIKTTGTAPGTILSWGGENNGQRWIFRVDANGALALGVGGGYVVTTIAVNDGQWHHVAAVLDSDGSPSVSEILLYVDGVPQSTSASTSQAIDTLSSQNVIIGAYQNSGISVGYFKGLIDDVCIYDRALDSVELLSTPSAGLVARWMMDQASGGRVIDALSTHNGTMRSAGEDVSGIWYMNGYPALNWEINPLQVQIDAAANGATIVVQPGLYQGRLNFKGKNIILTSVNPQDPNTVASTVIQGLGNGSVITFTGTETSDCVLSGFTITGGNSATSGGGVNGNDCSAVIQNCYVYGNTAVNAGGGIWGINGLITNCLVRNNQGSYGGAIAKCNGLITNTLMYDNQASIGGSAINNCDGTIRNCTVIDGSAGLQNLLRYCDGVFENCILVGTGTIFDTCTSTITYSCFPGAAGTGNISVDPMFVDPVNNDYHLLPGSPCIDAGDPTSDYSNEPWPNGSRVDMGAYGNTPEATLSSNVLIPLGFQIVDKTRAGRTAFEYELAVVVRNPNEYDMTNVQMQLKVWDAAVQSVLDDSVTIDSIPSGATVTSADTFRIIVDRSQLIVPGMLTWELTYYTAVSGGQLQQVMMVMSLSTLDAGAGDITGDGNVNLDDFTVLARQWNTVPDTMSADIALPLDDYVGIEDLLYLMENWLN